jgi:hypothetical protein
VGAMLGVFLPVFFAWRLVGTLVGAFVALGKICHADLSSGVGESVLSFECAVVDCAVGTTVPTAHVGAAVGKPVGTTMGAIVGIAVGRGVGSLRVPPALSSATSDASDGIGGPSPCGWGNPLSGNATTPERECVIPGSDIMSDPSS